MFDYTVELIYQAASNSFFVFCFCNLIVAIIFMGSKSSSALDGSWVLNSMPTCTNNPDEALLNADGPPSCREGTPLVEPGEVCARCNIQTEDDGGNNEEDEDHEDRDENGLRTRVEAFIAKVNREWQAENLREKAAR